MAQANPTPIRVAVAVSSKSPHWTTAWEHPDEIIQMATKYLREKDIIKTDDSTPFFLAKERYATRIMLVFDLFHESYDSESAHVAEQNKLSVSMVSLSTEIVLVNTTRYIQDEVNESIRLLHDLHGFGSRPPFTVDHAHGNIPTYPNPRWCRYLGAENK
ncbi:hypothetical protein MCOR25_010226 [Pyricularia grisea]|nr:hypothetical protein MCOR25_010226 [Pyricularia grisea]